MAWVAVDAEEFEGIVETIVVTVFRCTGCKRYATSSNRKLPSPCVFCAKASTSPSAGKRRR